MIPGSEPHDLAAAERFWRRELQGFAALTPLPVGRGSSPATEYHSGCRSLRLDQSLSDGLRRLTRERGLTFGTIVQGAWAILLGRYSGEDDVVFGAAGTCR